MHTMMQKILQISGWMKPELFLLQFMKAKLETKNQKFTLYVIRKIIVPTKLEE